MCRHLIRRERDFFGAAGLGQNETVALVNGNSTSEIRQGKGALPIAAVGGPYQIEKRFVLRDGQQLPFAKHPAGGRKVARENPNFSDVRLGHKFFSLGLAWENSLQGDTERQRQERLQIGRASCREREKGD